eukprot:scaffold3586_cov404-Prasinococcus_capsulatus_cf.AAC.31
MENPVKSAVATTARTFSQPETEFATSEPTKGNTLLDKYFVALGLASNPMAAFSRTSLVRDSEARTSTILRHGTLPFVLNACSLPWPNAPNVRSIWSGDPGLRGLGEGGLSTPFKACSKRSTLFWNSVAWLWGMPLSSVGNPCPLSPSPSASATLPPSHSPGRREGTRLRLFSTPCSQSVSQRRDPQKNNIISRSD